MTTTLGARRKLASDLRPGDTFYRAGSIVTVREVSLNPRTGTRVKYRTANGVSFTARFLAGGAVTPA